MIQIPGKESVAAKGVGNGKMYPVKYRNCRRIVQKSFTNSSKNLNSETGGEPDYVDEDFYNNADKVPRMELLKINYVNLSKNGNIIFQNSVSIPENPKMKMTKTVDLLPQKEENVSESNKTNKKSSVSKYTVYKKHNLFGKETEPEKEKDKFALDWDQDQSKKGKKYLLFDSKKRSKLENIQFYFDNKSYEQYVDNKIYGCTGGGSKPVQNDKPPKRKNSWKELTGTQFGNVKQLQSRYEKNTHTTSLSKSHATSSPCPKQMAKSEDEEIVLRNKFQRQTSMSDINRISLMFLEARRGSLDDKLMERFQSNISQKFSEPRSRPRSNEKADKIKRLVESFENKCSCSSDGTGSDGGGRENFILGKSNLIGDKSRLRHNQRISLPSENTILKNNNLVMGISSIDHSSNNARRSMLLRSEEPSGALSRSVDSRGGSTETSTKSSELVKRKNEIVNNSKVSIDRSVSQVPRKERPMSMPEKNLACEKGYISTSNAAKSCGYKNCNFVNCPISSSSGCNSSSSHSFSSSSSSDENSLKKVSKTRLNASPGLPRKEVAIFRSKTELQLQHDHYRSAVIATEGNKKGKFHAEKRNEKLRSIKQLESKIVTKYISEELKLISDKEKLNNQKNKEAVKRGRNVSEKIDNTVKIYVPSPPLTDASSISDSDKDYGYYDQVTESVSSQESSSSNNGGSKQRLKLVEPSTQNQEKSTAIAKVTNLKSEKRLNGILGCDGAIFWNDCYYYDEACARGNCKDNANSDRYVCVCRTSEKVMRNGKE